MATETVLIEKLAERSARFDVLSEELADPAVASDVKRFPGLLRERGTLEESWNLFQEWNGLVDRIKEADTILEEDGDEDLVELALEDKASAVSEQSLLLVRAQNALISDPMDNRTRVIVELRAGTGGDEATLFVADLLRMYTRLADSSKWRLETMVEQRSEVGGVREMVIGISGKGVWRGLRFESGGHRVQRVPSTESQGRIHTSAATVAVMPEAEEAEIDINDDDLDIDTMRAGGAGGQHVNKTESAIRLTHYESGVVVQCQDEKSQHKNLAKALRVLKSRLYEARRQEENKRRADTRRTLVGSGDRSQRIRTYNFPENRISDHRINLTLYKLDHVIAGGLQPVTDALIEHDRQALRDLMGTVE